MLLPVNVLQAGAGCRSDGWKRWWIFSGGVERHADGGASGARGAVSYLVLPRSNYTWIYSAFTYMQLVTVFITLDFFFMASVNQRDVSSCHFLFFCFSFSGQTCDELHDNNSETGIFFYLLKSKQSIPSPSTHTDSQETRGQSEMNFMVSLFKTRLLLEARCNKQPQEFSNVCKCGGRER